MFAIIILCLICIILYYKRNEKKCISDCISQGMICNTQTGNCECGGSVCSSGQTCINNACIESCNTQSSGPCDCGGIICPDGKVCTNNACVENCATGGCSANNACNETTGQCFCADTVCISPSICDDGKCILLCDTCTNGNTCNPSNGKCECNGITCTGQQQCDNNECQINCTEDCGGGTCDKRTGNCVCGSSPMCINGNTCNGEQCICGSGDACTNYGEQCITGECIVPCTEQSCAQNGQTCDPTTKKCLCGGSPCNLLCVDNNYCLESCKNNQDCANQSCIDGACQEPLADGRSCTLDKDCENQHCYYGKCTSSFGACTYQTDCTNQATQDCVNGACLSKPPSYGCTPGCADGYYCDGNECISFYGQQNDCVTNGCPDGQLCSYTSGCTDESLLTSCTTNGDCIALGTDAHCTNGYCSCGNSLSSVITPYSSCIAGNTINIYCSGSNDFIYPFIYGYTCNNMKLSCGDNSTCDYGQVCTNNQCV